MFFGSRRDDVVPIDERAEEDGDGFDVGGPLGRGVRESKEGEERAGVPRSERSSRKDREDQAWDLR